MQLLTFYTGNANACGKQDCLNPYRTLVFLTIGGHNLIFSELFVRFCLSLWRMGLKKKEASLLHILIKLCRAMLSKQECLMCQELDGCDLILLHKLLQKWFRMTDQSVSLVLNTPNIYTVQYKFPKVYITWKHMRTKQRKCLAFLQITSCFLKAATSMETFVFFL